MPFLTYIAEIELKKAINEGSLQIDPGTDWKSLIERRPITKEILQTGLDGLRSFGLLKKEDVGAKAAVDNVIKALAAIGKFDADELAELFESKTRMAR